jgi:hypothetical protein
VYIRAEVLLLSAGSEIRGGGVAKREKEGRIISSSIDRL